ncbi:acyl-CoA thioesterase [Tropicibacter sp. R15_0]|uniref:acyl-CoA thioesterase n=1 Tax=Tropicibacter sp. R15_0 TaxID=2821101 RepID=UPI001ADA4339|nr:acyl-CoA thioesterase [Tropicibacter sp. R15_0]MBO9464039.1 acyl-CoA thioesterase [Tropicibacter sp. R15_0]
MYPFLRMFKSMFVIRKAPKLDLFDTHVSHHMCWPWDIDFWMELNNGRTLTLYDLGRLPAGQRAGMYGPMRDNKWGMTVAGTCIRYRQRVRMFDKVEIRTRMLGWDKRFFYMDQSMWKTNGACSSHAVLRMALTDKNGIVDPQKLMDCLKPGAESPDLPDWVQKWIEAEDHRPWPPFKTD